MQKVKLYTAEKLAKLNAAQEKRETSRMEAFEASRRAEEASKVARRKAFLVENAADVALLTPLTDSPMFADILSRLTEDLHPLSENQRSAAKREIAKRTEIAASTYLGTVGEKITLVLHCDKIVSFEGFYGTTYLHLCHDKGGNCVTYKGRGNFLGEGDCLPVTAKVAEHSEYNGRKQTRIERPKVAW